MDVGNDANKNSNGSVDKAIDELEHKLNKLSPTGNKITIADLAQSTMALNCKMRNRGLTASASEIHFARNSHDHSNLVSDGQTDAREKNHPSLHR